MLNFSKVFRNSYSWLCLPLTTMITWYAYGAGLTIRVAPARAGPIGLSLCVAVISGCALVTCGSALVSFLLARCYFNVVDRRVRGVFLVYARLRFELIRRKSAERVCIECLVDTFWDVPDLLYLSLWVLVLTYLWVSFTQDLDFFP